MKTQHLLPVTLVLAWALAAVPAFATPTDICNAYNADITADGALVLYLWGDWGNDKYDDGHYVGFSYGLMDMFEVGGDWRITENEDFRQDPTLDAKFRFSLSDELTNAIAVGVDNINFDEDVQGKFIPYIVYTHDFEGLRAHAGYSFEEDNSGAFVGFDAATGDATLKWDWKQIADGDDWMGAVGFDMPFELMTENWVLSMFLTWSSNDDISDVWHAEINYTFGG